MYIFIMIKIAPSLLAADFSRIREEIRSTEKAQADWVHLDVMDGHFVTNISFGEKMIRTVDSLTNLPLYVHLMLDHPENFFESFSKAGADSIIFHIEVHEDPSRQLADLKKLGVEPGLSLNPDTDIKSVLPWLELCDHLLVMSVFPGYSGQEFIRGSLQRIEAAREYVDGHGLKTRIAVDGGVDPENAREVVKAGAHILIMGSAFYGSTDRLGLADKVRSLKR